MAALPHCFLVETQGPARIAMASPHSSLPHQGGRALEQITQCKQTESVWLSFQLCLAVHEMDRQEVGGDGGEGCGGRWERGLSGERERRWNRETDKFYRVCDIVGLPLVLTRKLQLVECVVCPTTTLPDKLT